MHSRDPRAWIADIAAYAFIAITLIVAVTPILWTFLSSFKFATDIATVPPKLLFTPTLENYRIVVEQGSLLPGLRSSIVVTLGATVLSLLIGAPAAYYLARSGGFVAVGLGGIVMSTRFIPVIVLLIPLLIAFRSLRLTGSFYGLMIAYQLATLPFVILVLWAAFTPDPARAG